MFSHFWFKVGTTTTDMVVKVELHLLNPLGQKTAMWLNKNIKSTSISHTLGIILTGLTNTVRCNILVYSAIKELKKKHCVYFSLCLCFCLLEFVVGDFIGCILCGHRCIVYNIQLFQLLFFYMLYNLTLLYNSALNEYNIDCVGVSQKYCMGFYSPFVKFLFLFFLSFALVQVTNTTGIMTINKK